MQVNLSHNQVGFVAPKTFPHHRYIPYRLEEVDLSHNVIPVLTVDLGLGMQRIKRLSLASNAIIDIRPGLKQRQWI